MTSPALSLGDQLGALVDALERAAPERGLRIEQVCQQVGLSPSRIYHLVAAGEFPKPRKVGEQKKGRGASLWLQSEVSRWLRELPEGG